MKDKQKFITVIVAIIIISSGIVLGAPSVTDTYSDSSSMKGSATDPNRNLIYVAVGDTVKAVDRDDMSTVLWTKSVSRTIYSIDYNVERDTIYVGQQRGTILAFDANTQNTLWSDQPLGDNSNSDTAFDIHSPQNHSYIYLGVQNSGMVKYESDGTVVWTQSVNNGGVYDLEYNSVLDVLFTGTASDTTTDSDDLRAWNPKNSGPILIWDRYESTGDVTLTTIGNRVYIGDGGSSALLAYNQSGSLVATGSSGNSADDRPQRMTSFESDTGDKIIVGESAGEGNAGILAFDTNFNQDWGISSVGTSSWGHMDTIKDNTFFLYAPNGDQTLYEIDTEYKPISYIINGTVTDKNTQSGIDNANIKAYSSGSLIESTNTNSSGDYSFNVSEGTYNIEYSKSGYKTVWKNNTKISKNTTINVQLEFKGPENLKIIVNPVFDPGETKDFKVRAIENGKVKFVEDKTNVISQNTTLFTVDNNADTVTANNIDVNDSTFLTTAYNGTTTRKKVMIGDLTIDNIADCPPEFYFLCFISIDDGIAFGLGSEMQILIAIIIIASGLAGATRNAYIGLGMLTALSIIFFAAGMLSLGIMIATLLICIAVAFGALDAERKANITIEDRP